MPFFEQDADPRDAPSDRPYDPNLVVRFLEEVEVDAGRYFKYPAATIAVLKDFVSGRFLR